MDEPKRTKEPDDSIPIRVTDRRSRFDASREQEPEADSSARHPTLVVELEERVRQAEEKLADALNLLRRRESEAEVFRTRLRKEMERRARSEMEAWMKTMLEVMDSLDRGVASAAGERDAEALRDGITKVRDQCLTILSRQGVEPMSLKGSLYDPHLAEAVAVAPASTPEEENLVVEDIRRGYTFEGQVLRPSQVKVARVQDPQGEDEGEGRSSHRDS